MEIEILAICITFILAGISTELTGFGVATISMALLPFFFPLTIAVPMVAMISTTSTGIVALKTKTFGLWKHMLALIAGSAVGIPIGMYLFTALNEDLLRLALAIFLIIYAVYGILKKRTFIRSSTPRSTAVGAVAGFFNASLNIHGPIVGLYASSNDSFSRNETRDIIATYMFFAGLLTVTGHYLADRITPEVGLYFLYALPFLGIGLYIGSKIFPKLNERTVRTFIYAFVLAAGILMIL